MHNCSSLVGGLMNKILFNNLTNEIVEEEKLLNDVLLFAMKKEKLDNTYFDVIFVNNDYIHNLNKNYRGIDRETDVITFALEDDSTIINGSNMRVLGDVYISLDKAHQQAEEYGHSFKRELSFLAVHGLYHLLGYDHMTVEDEKIMFGKQEEVLKEFNITREV